MLKIVDRLEAWLPTQPEYRMGYQKVVAKLNTGGIEKGIIVNSQVFLKEADYPWQMFMNWENVLKETRKSSLFVTSVQLIQRQPETLRGIRQIVLANEKFGVLAERKDVAINFSIGNQRSRLLSEREILLAKAASAAAEDAPVTLTKIGELFKRFSAYSNDRRITPGRGLTPGTFATTKRDADAHVKSGADAVSRYALPNSKPASNVFTIAPPNDTELKCGTAQPANGQPGGGEEVIFVNGLPNGTVSGPVIIPDRC